MPIFFAVGCDVADMYELSGLFVYRPLFMAEIIIAELMFARKFKLREKSVLRIICALVLCFGTAFAIPIVAFDTFYGSLLFVIMFAVTTGAMAIVYDAPFKSIVCCAIAGFTVQHVAQEMYEVFGSVLRSYGSTPVDFYGSEIIGISAETFVFLLIYFQIFFLVYTLSYWVLGKKTEIQTYEMNNLTVTIIAVLFVFINVVSGAVIIWSLPENIDSVGLIMLHIYNIICCLLALVMLFELPRRKRAETELAAVRQLDHIKKEQYRMSKENIEIISLKCHDLKHHIRTFKCRENISADEIDELEKVVDIYDSIYQTGNEAFNIILMEKSLICKSENINLSCIADAEQLSFISDSDIYTLFGNLLDNAIEAVRALPKTERSIGLSVKRINDFVAVHVYNGFEGEIRFENGLPVTRKASKAYHGFGLKSVRHTAEKYNGTLQVSAFDGIFNVKILFSVPPTSDAK